MTSFIIIPYSYVYLSLMVLLCIISLSKGSSFGPDSSTVEPLIPSDNSTESNNSTTLYDEDTPTFTCRNLTNSAQRIMCYKTPGLLKAIIDAEKLARKECIEQFRYERWNCSGFAMTTSSNITKQGNAHV